MRGTITPAEAHKQYSEVITAYRRFLPDARLRALAASELDQYIRRCVLGLWQADGQGGITPRHVEFYNAIYTPGTPPPSALYWEVATGCADYAVFQPPRFFDDLRAYDRTHGTALSRRFIDQLTLLLLLFASVDDVVSEEEAGFVNGCSDILLRLCDADRLPDDVRPPLRADDFIAPRPEEPAAPAAPAAPSVQRAEAQTAEKQPEEQAEPAPSLEELTAQLDSLCGLDKVKQDVKSLVNLVKVRKLRQQAQLPVPPLSLHLVFMGNPGTGKTTVARLLAKIYHAIGVLPKGQLVEVDRSGLVAGFVGQTALKTQKVIDQAIGGVLFIDEAYALVNQENSNDFGNEAIEVLLKNMEDHRDELIVIVAGYTNLMEKFIHANPGLESRFNKYFYFEDYDGDQLMEILRSMCKKNGYTLSPEGESWAREALRDLYDHRDENFGNARDVRNLFEKAVSRHSDRVASLEAPTREQLMELLPGDLGREDEDPATLEEDP